MALGRPKYEESAALLSPCHIQISPPSAAFYGNHMPRRGFAAGRGTMDQRLTTPMIPLSPGRPLSSPPAWRRFRLMRLMIAVAGLSSPGRNFGELRLRPRHRRFALSEIDVAVVAVDGDPIAS